MGLRNRLIELTSTEQVDQFLEQYRICAFFKAGACHKTMQGFGYVEEALNSRDDIPLAFVRVIENRPVSNYIAKITGVVHQSPQFILMIDKKPVYDVDNWYIVPEALEEALTQNVGAVKKDKKPYVSKGKAHNKPEAASYIELLRQYVTGNIGEEKFKFQWLALFQMDSQLRSSQEFNLLNSLFGDVDKAIEEEVLFNASESIHKSPQKHRSVGSLKSKAEILLKELEELF
jgi:bacillithiol system protein YtxJ